MPLEEGRTENHKPDYPAWHKPYAEALLETDPKILVKLVAATERGVFEPSWNWLQRKTYRTRDRIYDAPSMSF